MAWTDSDSCVSEGTQKQAISYLFEKYLSTQRRVATCRAWAKAATRVSQMVPGGPGLPGGGHAAAAHCGQGPGCAGLAAGAANVPRGIHKLHWVPDLEFEKKLPLSMFLGESEV